MAMVCPRLRRLFGTDGKILDVAIDHGVFNEDRFLNGIEGWRALQTPSHRDLSPNFVHDA